MYGEALYKPEMKEGNPIRLYSLDEITEIFMPYCDGLVIEVKTKQKVLGGV